MIYRKPSLKFQNLVLFLSFHQHDSDIMPFNDWSTFSYSYVFKLKLKIAVFVIIWLDIEHFSSIDFTTKLLEHRTKRYCNDGLKQLNINGRWRMDLEQFIFMTDRHKNNTMLRTSTQVNLDLSAIGLFGHTVM